MRIFIVFTILLSIATADKWALLVSGDYGWSNYCITSTVCRGFDILHRAGIAEDHIVYLGFNDIFENEYNPFPGQIFTDPSEGPGMDYGAECRPHIDYQSCHGFTCFHGFHGFSRFSSSFHISQNIV